MKNIVSQDRKAWRFFLDHAGYATPPGRAQCAMNLARAERRARDIEASFDWSGDPDGCSMCDSCPKEVQAHAVVEQCVMRSKEGVALASLHGICNANAAYRRVVEAELAVEAAYNS